MKERIQQRFNFKVKWQAGKKMIISDALSRAPVEECMVVSGVGDFNGVTTTEKSIVNAVTNDAEKVFGDQKLNSLLQKANTDQDYIALRDVVSRGFRRQRNMLPEKLKDFWIFKDELTNFKGFVFRNEKQIVIPAECRYDVLKDLHLAHQGVVRM